MHVPTLTAQVKGKRRYDEKQSDITDAWQPHHGALIISLRRATEPAF